MLAEALPGVPAGGAGGRGGQRRAVGPHGRRVGPRCPPRLPRSLPGGSSEPRPAAGAVLGGGGPAGPAAAGGGGGGAAPGLGASLPARRGGARLLVLPRWSPIRCRAVRGAPRSHARRRSCRQPRGAAGACGCRAAPQRP